MDQQAPSTRDEMATTPPPKRPVASSHHQKRVAIAGFSGTLIEFYDFIIYGIAAALVFPEIFFPALGTAAGTAAAFATFGVAFVARPFGGVLFGHFGDRLGRKTTLVSTLLLMGIATVGVGLVPTVGEIGIAAPIIVIVLRIVQGLAAGGEWAGATLFTAEHAPAGKRGFWSMFPLLGGSFAVSLANGTFLLTGLGMSDEMFTSWGWRVPFLGSVILIAIGLWVRLTIDESPVFSKEVKNRGRSRMPFVAAVSSQPRTLLLAAGIGLTTFAYSYVSSTYLTTYATKTLELSRTFVLTTAVLGGIVLCSGIIVGAPLGDRVGRRPVLIGTSALGLVWSLSLFPILENGPTAIYAPVVLVTFFISGMNYGPLGSFIPELFNTRYRYTATGLSYNLGTVLAGGIAPLLAAPIVSSFGTFAYGIFLAALSLTAIVCTLALRETSKTAMTQEVEDIGRG